MLDFDDRLVFVPKAIMALDAAAAHQPDYPDDQKNDDDHTDCILVHIPILSAQSTARKSIATIGSSELHLIVCLT